MNGEQKRKEGTERRGTWLKLSSTLAKDFPQSQDGKRAHVQQSQDNLTEVLGGLVNPVSYWIGLSREKTSSSWKWVDGGTLSREVGTIINNFLRGNCAEGYWDESDLLFHPADCNEEHMWICERGRLTVVII
nr:PREDICTED: killer cell lectin-like receptor subfamily B member 1A [Lepisosteus oculatus]